MKQDVNTPAGLNTVCPAPPNEISRLQALLELHIPDTPPEAAYGSAARLAAHKCGMPTAAISLVMIKLERCAKFRRGYGQQVADKMLVDFADHLRKCEEAADVVPFSSRIVVPFAIGRPMRSTNNCRRGTDGVSAKRRYS